MSFINVSKKYGDTVVFQNFSLSVEEGKITTVLGESGSGKTTLLNIAAGLTPYQGKADFARTSYVFQDARLLPNLTVEDNLKFVLPKEVWGRIPVMLEKVGLAGKEKRYPSTLSGGEKKRVSLLRAFLYPHDVLLLDEPFSAVDVAIKRDLIALVVSLWQEQKNTVLLVSHDVHEAALLSHRAVVLKNGKIVCDIPFSDRLPRDFFAKYTEEDALIQGLLS